MLATEIFVFMLFFIIITYLFKRNSGTVKLVDQFEGPPTIPVFGNLHQMADSAGGLFVLIWKLTTKFCGRPFRLWVFHRPYIVISRPEDIKAVSQTSNKDIVYRFLADVLGDGMITNNGEKWKRSRTIINPAFYVNILNTHYLEIFNKHSLQLVENLKKEASTGNTFDMWLYVYRASINTIYETAMGTTIDVNEKILSQLEESMPKAMDLVFQRCYQPWLHPTIIFNAYLYLKGDANIFQNVLDFHKKMIQRKRKSFNARASSSINKEENKCVVDILLELNELHELTDKELVNEVITLLFAGSETSSIAVCSTLMMLAKHPEIQEKVYEEINDNVNSSDQHISIEDLSKLTFLEQCLKESMRRYTVVPVVLRQIFEDVTLNDGRTIPRGANIALVYRMTHENADLYPNPRNWNPHNFDPETIANRPAYSFNPFSVGPRVCLGYKYAMLSMKVTVATILRNYKLSTNQEKIRMSASFISRCRQGYFMKLQPRSQEPTSAEYKDTA